MSGDQRDATMYEIDRVGCLVLLASQRVGRLVVGGSEPEVMPVNYVVMDGTIVFRTDTGSRAAASVGMPAVFEVDVIDESSRTGWSVVAHGTLDDITARIGDDPVPGPLVEPWAPGPKDRVLRIVVKDVTGRWVRGPLTSSPLHQRGYL